MAKTRKTQQHDTATPPDAAAIAQHFMAVWQDQWQGLARQPAAANNFADLQKQWLQAANAYGSAFGATLLQHPQPPHGSQHAPSDAATVGALELATAALAASEQCLELLKQCARRLDELSTRIDGLDGSSQPKRAGQSATAKRTAKK